MRFQSSEAVNEFFVPTFPHFIDLVTINDANTDIINFVSIINEKGEIFHSGGIKVLDKSISHSSFGFADVQLITSLAREMINDSCGDA